MRAAIGLVAGAMLLAGSTSVFAQAPGASADVKMANGDAVGMATFTQESGGVRLKGQFKGLTPGDHGIHVHAVGKCDGPDFMTAGAHYNPTNKQHGLNNPQGSHAGDMVNLTAASDGSGTIDYLLKDVTLGSGTGSLFGPDGTALVIHAMPDDEMTDPSGNSGGRIACGLIARMGTAAQAAPAAQPSPSPAAKPAASPAAAPAAQPAASPAAKPAAPAQAPAAKASPVASPAALPRTGAAGLPIDASLPAAVVGLGSMIVGLALWRRRR
jgi:Cu-Zn family superoxide dismutase